MRNEHYELVCDEPFWVLTRMEVTKTETEDGEERIVTPSADPDHRDLIDGERRWYWIESDDREDKLKVPDFTEGERILMELQASSKDFEDFVESDNAVELVAPNEAVY